jgi:hypothetical protein
LNIEQYIGYTVLASCYFLLSFVAEGSASIHNPIPKLANPSWEWFLATLILIKIELRSRNFRSIKIRMLSTPQNNNNKTYKSHDDYLTCSLELCSNLTNAALGIHNIVIDATEALVFHSGIEVRLRFVHRPKKVFRYPPPEQAKMPRASGATYTNRAQ